MSAVIRKIVTLVEETHIEMGKTPMQAALDTVASHVEASLDMGRLETIIWGHSPVF